MMLKQDLQFAKPHNVQNTKHKMNTYSRSLSYIQQLKNLKDYKNLSKILENIDLDEINVEKIGKYFENSLDRIERKQHGQYYTHSSVIQYMLESLSITDSSKVLDPTCGCGSFVLGIHDYLTDKYNKPNLNNIFGVDLNPTAVDITRLCLFLKSIKSKGITNILDRNIRVGDSINNDLFSWETEFKDIMSDGGFDYIVGNPPYGFLNKTEFDHSRSEYVNIMNGRLNIASVVIVKSLSLLKDNGMLALLVPKSILHVESYRNLREYLLSNCTILEIYDLGITFADVRGEQIILFLQKKKTKPKTLKISSGIDKNSTNIITPKKSIKYNYTCLTPDKFLILDNPNQYTILDKIDCMKNTTSLTKFVNGQIFRGIPLESIPKKTLCTVPSPNTIKILRGRSISKYKIVKPYYCSDLNLNNHIKHKVKTLSSNKLVLQNIFSPESGLISSFDSEGTITLDTVTNVIVDNDVIGKYLLGLFNSKLITFYLLFGLFNRSKLTIHIDKRYLGQIPIHIKPDTDSVQNIVNLVDRAMTTDDYTLIKEITHMIDGIVFKLYNISKTDINIISDAVDQHLSIKSRW